MMPRRELEELARAELARLPEEAIEPVLLRATGRKVVCWTYLTSAELERVFGAARGAALIWGVLS